MTHDPAARFEIIQEEGPPHGDLYELEQTTYFHVIDRRTGQVLMTFQGEMSASLSREGGGWDDYRFYGAKEVTISPEQQSVVVTNYDGRQETYPLPLA